MSVFSTLGLVIIALINDVGPKIKVDDVGFSACPFTIFVATLLFYVATQRRLLLS